jgi:hypothetical protein
VYIGEYVYGNTINVIWWKKYRIKSEKCERKGLREKDDAERSGKNEIKG